VSASVTCERCRRKRRPDESASAWSIVQGVCPGCLLREELVDAARRFEVRAHAEADADELRARATHLRLAADRIRTRRERLEAVLDADPRSERKEHK